MQTKTIKIKKLEKTIQCDKCPFKKETNPFKINNYDIKQHKELRKHIANPNEPNFNLNTLMACHESCLGKNFICVGWLYNQLGAGNNIALRMAMLDCENRKDITVIGEQHKNFEDTIPKMAKKRLPRLSISCPLKTKTEIDFALSHVSSKKRSQYILKLIEEAIKSKKGLVMAQANGLAQINIANYKDKNLKAFHVSCSKEQFFIINEFCNEHLPPKSRSKWIINLIISDFHKRVKARLKEIPDAVLIRLNLKLKLNNFVVLAVDSGFKYIKSFINCDGQLYSFIKPLWEQEIEKRIQPKTND